MTHRERVVVAVGVGVVLAGGVLRAGAELRGAVQRRTEAIAAAGATIIRAEAAVSREAQLRARHAELGTVLAASAGAFVDGDLTDLLRSWCGLHQLEILALEGRPDSVMDGLVRHAARLDIRGAEADLISFLRKMDTAERLLRVVSLTVRPAATGVEAALVVEGWSREGSP